jgi:urease beta subunit
MSVRFENGKPSEVTVIHYEVLEKLFGTEVALKIKQRLEV